MIKYKEPAITKRPKPVDDCAKITIQKTHLKNIFWSKLFVRYEIIKIKTVTVAKKVGSTAKLVTPRSGDVVDLFNKNTRNSYQSKTNGTSWQ